MEQKVIEIKGEGDFINKMALKKLQKEGWIIKSINTADRGYSAGKTLLLGAIFLPLALLGKKSAKTIYLLEKE